MKIILLFFFIGILFGQALPTVPNNVFRISVFKSLSNSNWNLSDNKFSLDHIGKNYFDYGTHNDSMRFSSDYDLYYNGATYIDSSTTIFTPIYFYLVEIESD
mgnify:CR=1 FL=1